MPWVRLDDSFYDHPKTTAVERENPAALVLLVKIWTFSSRHLTDGFITVDDLFHLARVPKRHALAQVKLLVRVRFLDQGKGGYQVHNFLRYNRPAAEIKADRDATRQRVHDWRQKKRRDATSGQYVPGNAVTAPSSNATCNSVTGSSSVDSNAIPVPVPVPGTTEVRSKSPTRSDGGVTTSNVALAPLQGKSQRRGPDPRITTPTRQYTGRPSSGEFATLLDSLKETYPTKSAEEIEQLAVKRYDVSLRAHSSNGHPEPTPDAPAHD
jgi:hypothetical protein